MMRKDYEYRSPLKEGGNLIRKNVKARIPLL